MPVTCAFPAHRCALRGTTGAYGFREIRDRTSRPATCQNSARSTRFKGSLTGAAPPSGWRPGEQL